MPHPGWSEQDPDDWVAATEAVLAELGADDAAGIGLTGQMHGLVALGSDDRPLRPAILWNDGRSQPQATAIEQRLGIERLVELSGNRVLAGFTAPKLAWLAEHEPDVHRRIARVMLPKDYVRFRLTGELGTDVSDASGTRAARRRPASMEPRAGRGLCRRPRVAAAGPRVPRGERAHGRRAFRSPPARAIRRPARSGSASPTPAARRRWCWARAA